MENKDIDKLFEDTEKQWDVYTMDPGHLDRFSKKLHRQKRNRDFKRIFAIAASVVVLIGLFVLYPKNDHANELQFASQETRQTDSVFSMRIARELELIKAKKTSKNEKIVNDALRQMKSLNRDYEEIKQELLARGECQPIIYAMVSNLQTRISFLQEVQQNLEENEKLNNTANENTI